MEPEAHKHGFGVRHPNGERPTEARRTRQERHTTASTEGENRLM